MEQTMKKPNILFIMTDQESTSLSGCYGNSIIKTPARDSIACNGVRFDNHYIASFPCCPSRATMITGKYAHNHGVPAQNIVLDENLETLGSQLSRAGYETIWIGKSHLGGWFEPHDEPTCPYSELVVGKGGYSLIDYPSGAGGEDYQLNGFNTWVSGWTDYRRYLQKTDLPDEIKYDRWVGGHAVMETGPDSEHAYSRLTKDHHMANWMSSEAVKRIHDCKESDEPFCMVLSYYAPHHPVAPPQPYDAMYDPNDLQLPDSYYADTSLKNMPPPKKVQREDDLYQSTQRHSYGNYVAGEWTEAQAKDYLARYYGYVTYIDDQMTRVLTALQETGQYENTLVVFTSDHGDMLCEHGMIYKHCFNGFDTLMKVPMMMQWPAALPKGAHYQGLSSHVDIVQTLMDLAGVEPTALMDGISLVKSIRDGDTYERNAVYLDVMNNGYMIRSGYWKYVLNASVWNGEFEHKMDELYNLQDDPSEVHNLAQDEAHRLRIASMREQIYQWLEHTGHPYVSQIRIAGDL
jgi:arylsulfatase A-like enzyme